MPTNDERREVAARLREIEVDNYCCCEDYLDALEEAIGCRVGIDYGEPTYHLADLIEPEPECIANIIFAAEQQEELFQRVMEELRVNVSLTEAVDAICGQMCGDGWDWRMRAETVVRTIAKMCGAKVVND